MFFSKKTDKKTGYGSSGRPCGVKPVPNYPGFIAANCAHRPVVVAPAANEEFNVPTAQAKKKLLSGSSVPALRYKIRITLCVRYFLFFFFLKMLLYATTEVHQFEHGF